MICREQPAKAVQPITISRYPEIFYSGVPHQNLSSLKNKTPYHSSQPLDTNLLLLEKRCNREEVNFIWQGSIISKIFAVVVSKFLTFTLFPLMRNNPNLSH